MVVLELAADAELGVVISDRLIQENLVNMEVEWVTLNTGNHGDGIAEQAKQNTEMEVSHFPNFQFGALDIRPCWT